MESENTTEHARTCFLPEPPIIWYWSLRILISIATIIGNGVIIFLISTRRRLQNTPNMFILSLAVADFCFGVFSGPVFLTCTFSLQCNWTVVKTLVDIFLNASVLNLCTLTFDRYMAIVFPLRYQMSFTMQKTAGLVAATWILSGTSIIPYYACMYTDSAKAVYISYISILAVLELMPTAGMVFAYFHMLKIVRGHIGKIKIQRAQVGFNHDIVGRSGNVKTHESSSLNVIGAVILVFILCNFISIYRSLCLLVFPESCSSPELLVIFSRLLLVSNSAVNFVIYALFKKDIRHEVMKLLPGNAGCKCKASRRSFPVNNQVYCLREKPFTTRDSTNGI